MMGSKERIDHLKETVARAKTRASNSRAWQAYKKWDKGPPPQRSVRTIPTTPEEIKEAAEKKESADVASGKGIEAFKRHPDPILVQAEKENYFKYARAKYLDIVDLDSKYYIPGVSPEAFSVFEHATKSYLPGNQSNQKVILRTFAIMGLEAARSYGEGAERDVKFFKKRLKKLNKPSKSGKLVEIFRR